MITPEVIAAAQAELASVPHETVRSESGEEGIRYTFPEGQFVLPASQASSGGEVSLSPVIGTGWDGGETYISFNHTDQLAIKNGANAALTVAICAFGPVAGVIATVAAAAAGTYTSSKGICPGNNELWVYFSQRIDGNPSYSRTVCRPVSYPGGG